MKELLELILQNITTHPDQVVVEESSEDGRKVFTITVDPEDMGRVIGKDGKVIRAIRSLAHVVAVRHGERYRIKLADVEGKDQPEAQPQAEASTEPATEPTPEETAAEDDDDLLADTIEIPSEEKPEIPPEAEAETEAKPKAKPKK